MQKPNSIIRRLYENNLNGKISDDRFTKMMNSYEKEPAELESGFVELHDLMDDTKDKSDGIDRFSKMVRVRTEITELMFTITREF